MVDLHLVAQALAGAGDLAHAARCGGIYLGALGCDEIQPFVRHLQVIHGIVLDTHGGAHLHIRHILDGQGEGRDAVGLFLENPEDFIEVSVNPGSHGHKAVGMLVGGVHVVFLRQGFVLPDKRGGIAADLIQGRRLGLEQFFVNGLVLVQQTFDDISYELFLGFHTGVHIAVKAVFPLQTTFFLGGEEQGKENIEHNARGNRCHRIPQDGHQNLLGFAVFLLGGHQLLGFLTISA